MFDRRQFELLTLGDRALQRRLIESFLEQSSRTRADVLAAAQGGPGQFAQIVHRLKGSCHFTAADHLLWTLRSIESAAEPVSEEHRLMQAHAIVSMLTELEAALACFLAADKAA